jgi:hypothetical protein
LLDPGGPRLGCAVVAAGVCVANVAALSTLRAFPPVGFDPSVLAGL